MVKGWYPYVKRVVRGYIISPPFTLCFYPIRVLPPFADNNDKFTGMKNIMVTIKEIRNLTNEQRNEIRNELRSHIYEYVEAIGWTNNAHKNFACPICGAGSRTPNTSINKETYTIKSWSCGCLEGADLFEVILKNEPTVSNTFEALTFACNLYGYSLSAGSAEAARPSVTVSQPRKYEEPDRPVPPSQEWQSGAKRFTELCEKNLWSPVGENALRYLTVKRRFTKKTLEYFHIGYNPKPFYHNGSWTAPAGITIPTFIGADLFRVKVRRDDEKPKYQNYIGSVACCPFNEYDLLHEIDVIVVEGEFDAMTIYQAGDCGVCTFGSATSIPSAVTWREWLKNPDRICICLDADKAGDNGNDGLYAEICRLKNIRPVSTDAVFVRSLPKPADKKKYDWNDFYVGGGDVTAKLDEFFPIEGWSYGTTSTL